MTEIFEARGRIIQAKSSYYIQFDRTGAFGLQSARIPFNDQNKADLFGEDAWVNCTYVYRTEGREGIIRFFDPEPEADPF